MLLASCMRRYGAFLVLCSLLALGSAEEGAAAAAPESAAQSPGIAGFHPVSDVAEHAKIDLDIKEIQGLKSGWAAAKKIYEEGKNSKKSSGALRNLEAFSSSFVDSKSKQDEPMAKLGNAFWGRYDFGDALVTAALDGTDAGELGNFATGTLAKTEDARLQIVKKGIKFTVLWLYALHEIESALSKYGDGKLDVAKGAPHALDEAWVFYAGSLEEGSGSGMGPYSGAEKFAKKFGTYGYEMGTGGRSKVNAELLYQFTAMQRYLQTAGNGEVLADIAKCIRAQFKVPLVQGCLSYAFQASSVDEIHGTTSDNVPKIKAEAWAFCSAVLPSLNEADPASAVLLRNTVTINSDARPDWAVVKAAFSTANLNKMGIKCEDIGILGSGGYNFDAFAVTLPYTNDELKICSDDTALISSNPYADSSKCATLKMPRCGNDIVCSSSSSLFSKSSFTLIGGALISLFSFYSCR